MILKRLFENQDLLIERILIKEQKRLKLTNNQLLVLIGLFSLYKKQVFSLTSISRKVDLSTNEIGVTVDELIDKKYLTISLEQKDGKAREIFSLDQVFVELESLYEHDQKALEESKNESNISETISIFEQNLGKALSAHEMERIRNWYASGDFEHRRILNLIEQVSQTGRLSVIYLERMLHSQNMPQQPIDDKADQVIDQIFKKIK